MGKGVTETVRIPFFVHALHHIVLGEPSVQVQEAPGYLSCGLHSRCPEQWPLAFPLLPIRALATQVLTAAAIPLSSQSRQDVVGGCERKQQSRYEPRFGTSCDSVSGLRDCKA
jgi:hypothetical protein